MYQPFMKRKRLLLADGSHYMGYGFGADQNSVGEVVFNTGMTGYQETLSDPSYKGQIVLFTYPLIGNVGINADDFEALDPSVAGVIVSEVCRTPSNFRSEMTLDQAMKAWGIPGIWGLDTRALTRKIRQSGTIKGKILDSDADIEQELARLQALTLSNQQIQAVSCQEIQSISGQGPHVALLDLGMKEGILSALRARHCRVTVFPYQTDARTILASKPDGLVISNGPGDPQSVPEVVATVRILMEDLPTFGICMGHQVIALAAGASTYRLTFGHRGANHPVKNLRTGRVDLTSQNHGYSVALGSLAGTELECTHCSLNDGTCEGLRHRRKPIFSVQYHPEACPGPHDTSYHFDQFMQLMTSESSLSTSQL